MKTAYKKHTTLKKQAFTLVEFLAVLAFIALLSVGATLKYNKTHKKSLQEGIQSDKAILKSKTESFLNRVGDYPVLPDNLVDYKDENTFEFTETVKKALLQLNNVEYTDKGDAYLNQRFKIVDKNRLKQNGYIGELINNDTSFIYDINSNEIYYAKDDLETIVKGLEEALSLKDLRKTRVDYVIGSDKMNKAYDAISIGNITYVGGEGSMMLIKVIESNGKVLLEDLTDKLPAGITKVNSLVKGEGNEIVIGYMKGTDQQYQVLKLQ